MTEPHAADSRTHRILVALDASTRGRAALAAAVQLALTMRAELRGLFVEDEDLMRLASLPFAREVDFTSASARKLQTVRMERQLRAAADEAQRAFVDATQESNLRWTFRVVRGTITQASLEAAEDVDLLVIGQQGRRPPVMTGDFLPHRTDGGKRIVVVFDGSPSAFRAIELADNLAHRNATSLAVFVLASSGDEPLSQCVTWLRQQGIRAEVNQVIQPSQDAIIDYVSKYPPSVLVINRDSDFIGDAQIRRLVNEFDCPLILC